MEKLDLYIFGAGGLGVEVFCQINGSARYKKLYRLKGFIDEKAIEVPNNLAPVFSLDKILGISQNKKIAIFIAVADPYKRFSIKEKLKSGNVTFPSFLLGKCYSDFCSEEGTFIAINCIINPNVHIGKFTIIDEAVIIGHDTRIGSFCMAFPRVFIAGNVICNDFVQFGANSTTIQGLSISKNVFIGAGAVVIKNLEESGTYVGVPVRKIASK